MTNTAKKAGLYSFCLAHLMPYIMLLNILFYFFGLGTEKKVRNVVGKVSILLQKFRAFQKRLQ